MRRSRAAERLLTQACALELQLDRGFVQTWTRCGRDARLRVRRQQGMGGETMSKARKAELQRDGVVLLQLDSGSDIKFVDTECWVSMKRAGAVAAEALERARVGPVGNGRMWRERWTKVEEGGGRRMEPRMVSSGATPEEWGDILDARDSIFIRRLHRLCLCGS